MGIGYFLETVMIRAALVTMLFSCVALAQDPAVAGLKAGDAVPETFRAFLAADSRFEKDSPKNRAKKMHDLVTDNGLNPVLVAFVRSVPAADTPAAKLARRMSELVETYKPERLGGFMIFLTLDKEYQQEENRDPKAKAAEDLSAQLQSGNVPFGLAAKESAATKAWGLSDKDEIVVVYYNRLRVQKVWSFAADKLTDEEIKAIGTYVNGELKSKR